MAHLLGRKQYCSLNGVSSEIAEVRYGIPQGSCLGPLLFLIFVNDLPLTLKNAEPSIFADDTSFTASADSIPSLLRILDENIESPINWMTSNKLTLNKLKTEFLVIASRAKVKEVKETFCIHIQGEPIYRLAYPKSLGFYINQQLDWEDHVTHVVKNAIPVFQLFGVPRDLYQRKHCLQFIAHLLRAIYVMASQYGGNCGDTLLTKITKDTEYGSTDNYWFR